MAMRLVMLLTLLISLGALASTAVVAQDSTSSDPNVHPELEEPARVVSGSSDDTTPLGPSDLSAAGSYGTAQGATWIAASQFTVALSSAASGLSYDAFHFYNSPGGTHRYFAQLQVEPGVRISHLTCVYDDDHATENVRFAWQKYHTDLSSGTRTGETLDSFETTGTPGVDFAFLDPGSETMSTYDGSNGLINHYIAADVTSGTAIAGCWAFWNRQVAPAPGSATFDDVPTGHLFFQHVEALAGSGTTSGCDADSFCPDSSLTRGQMAVFLSKALGLDFQY